MKQVTLTEAQHYTLMRYILEKQNALEQDRPRVAATVSRPEFLSGLDRDIAAAKRLYALFEEATQ